MTKPNICLCGPLNPFKESAVESKILELVNYSEGYFENIFVIPNQSPLVFSNPNLYTHIKSCELKDNVGRLYNKGAMTFPYLFNAFPLLGNKYKVDLIDISFVYNAALLTKIAEWKKVPTVVNALGADIVVRKNYNYGFRQRRLNNIIIKYGLAHATRICTLSRFMKGLLIEMGVQEEKIEVIPTGVNINAFKSELKSDFRNQYRLDNNPVVMYLGSFIPIKGLIYLIKAARLIKDTVSDVKFVFMHFYKDKEYLENCWNLIDYLDLKKDILYLNSVPHNFIPDILAGCDVYIHASFSESLGRSILEAMACGKPVVVSNTGAMPEYIRNGENGFLVNPGDTEVFAENVIRLLCDSSLRENMGSKARKIIEVEYSLEVTALKRLNMFKKLLS